MVESHPDPSDPDDPPCSRGSVVAIAPGYVRSVPATCRRWSCDSCGRRKARRLAARFSASSASRLLTLTARAQPDRSREDLADELNAAWRSLWKRIRRLHGDRARGYLKVLELTAAGTPHLHLGIDTPYLSQRWLTEQWSELTGYRIVDIRRIHSASSLGFYLAKYLTKTHDVVAGRRKWSASSGFLAPGASETRAPDGTLVTWRFDPSSTVSWLSRLAQEGWVYAEGWWRHPT